MVSLSDMDGNWTQARARGERAVRGKSLAPHALPAVISRVEKTEPRPEAPARLLSLDALRGLCAGIVFLSHWHLWSDFTPVGAVEVALRHTGEWLHDSLSLLTWPTGGHHPAVLGFFVLSGFCIHYPFARRALAGEPPPPWRDYFGRRFRRIMPVYWAATALGLVFVAAEALRPTSSPLLRLHATGSLEDIVVRVTAMAGLYPREIFAGNYILTTVTVEIFMYAAYPLIYAYAARGRWITLGSAFLALHVLAITLLRFFTPYWIFNSVFMLGIFWYAGALAAHLYLTARRRVAGSWVLLVWAGFLGLKTLPHFTGLNLLKQGAWGLVCMLGILWIVDRERRSPCTVGSPPVVFLGHVGAASYSLYAMHTPAIMLATWTLLQFGVHRYALQLVATLAASLCATALAYETLERRYYRSVAAVTPPPR
ncbi:MAG: acyltransferase [Opitutaceae bacterium]